MKKLFIFFLCFVLCLSACGTEVPEQPEIPMQPSFENFFEEPDEEPSKPEDFFTYEAYPVKTWTSSIGTPWAQVVLKVTNILSENLYLNSSSIDLETETGALFATQNYINAYPQIIAPGESAYYYETIMLDSEPPEELIGNWHINVQSAAVEQIQFPVTDVTISSNNYGYIKAIGRVENTTSEQQNFVLVSIMLFDAKDAPIGHMFTYVDLGANDKMGFECSGTSLPPDVTVDAIASYVAVAYPQQYQF